MEAMAAANFLRQPDREAQIYFAFGEERYLLDAIKDAVCEIVGSDAMNTDVREGKVAPAEIIAIADQMPCFAPYRLLILRNLDLFASVEGEKLAGYLAQMPKTTRALITYEGTPDKRRTLYQYLAKHAIVIKADAPKGEALVTWLINTAKKEGMQMAREDAQLLIAISGTDMLTLKSEIVKLSMLGKRVVTEQDIRNLASATTEYSVFLMHTLMLEKNYKEAFSLAKKIFAEEKTYIPLVAFLANRFHLMYMAKCCLLSGMHQQAAAGMVAKNAKISPYAAKYAVKECERFSIAHLKMALSVLCNYEFALKSGGADAGMEWLLIRIYEA